MAAEDARLTTQRRNRLLERLGADGIATVLVALPENIRYFGGPTGARWLAFDKERLWSEGDLPTRAVAVDGAAAQLVDHEAEAGAAIFALRRSKDQLELAALARAAAVVDAGADAAMTAAADGARDDTALEAAHAAMDALAQAVAFEDNLGLGPGSADPDAHPTGDPAGDGAVGFVDLYPNVDGYYGDISRGLAAGTPSERATEIHAILWSALAAAARLLVSGTAAAEVDATCRGAVLAAGLPDYDHHTGHGLGLAQQEHPWITPDSPDVLRVGDVVTLEPGYYELGWGGMRVEDTFVVTGGPPRRLTSAPRTLGRAPR